MRMGSKLVSAALSLVFLPLGIQAQEVDTTSFNALEYSMQKRYRPRNEAFVSEKFLDNTFMRAGMGTVGLFRNSVSSYSQGPSVSVSVGKMFDPLNAVSVGGTVSEFRRNVDGVRVWRVGAGISHSFDLRHISTAIHLQEYSMSPQ